MARLALDGSETKTDLKVAIQSLRLMKKLTTDDGVKAGLDAEIDRLLDAYGVKDSTGVPQSSTPPQNPPPPADTAPPTSTHATP